MRSNNKQGIDAAALAKLLKAVNLGGLVDECVLAVGKGVANVQAVDISNALFLSCREKVGMEDMEIGVSKLTAVQKFLDSGGDFTVSVKDARMTIKRLSPAGELKNTLLAVEQVPTAVQQQGSEKELMKNTEAVVDVTREDVENLLYYTSLVETPSIVFVARPNGSVYVNSSPGMEQEFNFKLGVASTKPKETATSEVYTKYLLPVLRVLSWEEGEIVPQLHIGQESPVVVTVGRGYMWALTPVVKGE